MKAAWGLLLALLASGPALAGEAPEALVARLVPSGSAQSPDREAEDALVALGEAALPALERELRLGVRGHAAQAYSDSRRSKRWAVVRVLARIPGARTTDLLVRALADPPDTLGMWMETLRAVRARTLARAHLASLLTYSDPEPVLLALRKTGSVRDDAEFKPLVEHVFDPEQAAQRFRNVVGSPTAVPDELWEVRLASGQALGIDMVPEMRTRARALLAALSATVKRLRPDAPAAFLIDASDDEAAILHAIGALRALGEPVQGLVKSASEAASGDEAAVLDIARLALGESDRVPLVAATLTDSANGSLRYCAAVALREAKDRRALPALYKALEDPLQRVTGSCLRIGDGRVFPVRQVAASALIALGEDPKAVRAKASEAPPR